ncbi:MAG: HAMP domain-containing sensor histidine kinase [Rugosibacter sp.]|nr:HAMP domain-containing sensor histidine kinase [Rugosibacter sp.]
MNIHYPKSFFKLLSVGFLLAVLPLIIGLLINTVAIQQLSTQSQRAIYDAARVAHAARELSETANSLERAAQQSVILQDITLWESYLTLHHRFVNASAQLEGLPLESFMRQELAELQQEEQQLNSYLMKIGIDALEAPDAAIRYVDIADTARQLLTRSSRMIDKEAESLRVLAAQTETQVKRQLFLLLPLSIFIVAGFTYLLARPIAQLEQGIRDLGERRLDARIEVNGPDDLKQLGDRLDWLRLRLVQLEEQKSRFLRHISHELKTPLTALREGSDLLAEKIAGPLTEKQHEIVRILRQHSLDLQRLIEDLLRHGESDFHQTPLKLQSVKPGEVVEKVIDKQCLTMTSRNINLEMKIDDFVMRTDPERLRIVFDNLLSNAIKFSPLGGTIIVSATKDGSDALFSVIDDGPGVADEDLDSLFDPFYRGQAVAAGVVKGSGLGLSITKEHVLTLGGEITVGRGKGIFTVRLPLNL